MALAMLNDQLTNPGGGRCTMTTELLLAAFIMAVGLSIAGAGTHLYQFVWRAPAMLSFAGSSYLATLGHLVVSFVCGPYIMLKMGWKREENEAVSLQAVVIAAFVSFGWAFITGLLFLGVYLAIFNS